MIDKVLLGLTCLIAAIVGLATLPYWLYRAWANRISLRRKRRGLDLDYREPKPVG